jgi:hypothetical protein
LGKNFMTQPNYLSQAVFVLFSGAGAGEIHFKPEDWRFLARVDGVHSVAEIAQMLSMDLAAAEGVAEALYKAGLLQIAAGAANPLSATVNGDFFDHVTREFAQVMGPLASVVIEDEVTALGETREKFPRDRLAELVERLGQVVHDDAMRLQFQRIMLETIRKF